MPSDGEFSEFLWISFSQLAQKADAFIDLIVDVLSAIGK
jgi:hypothetical protein